MKVDYFHEGDIIDSSKFNLEDRDFKVLGKNDSDENDENIAGYKVSNFVGLIFQNDNLIVSFPKNYKVTNFDKDSKLIFDLILNFQSKNKYGFGYNELNNEITSTYPFKAFSEVYQYFQNNGPFISSITLTNHKPPGKINWRETIRKSNNFISNDNTILYPYYYDKKKHTLDFINECMIFCIDYTINKFEKFMHAQPTGLSIGEYDFIKNRYNVAEKLFEIRTITFNDNLINLLDNLVLFFTEFENKATFKLKHYNFHNVWEIAVKKYLNEYFERIENDKIVFSKTKKLSSVQRFNKHTFRPNKANLRHSINPDFYFSDNNNQIIFDAKYKSDIVNIDYKQLMYFIILEEYKAHLKTYSALIMPSNSSYQKIHFKMEESFSHKNKNLVVYELYLNAKEILENYLK
ncbi:hypothetical protein NGB24_08770 [Mammaliicoccus vitulinus]|uniref:hypothetical protein n=1 Tax=Mammaliicoccus vitulinus TaxID=71237 RepID=UPI002DB72F49|nr:hypothetical protein [Mammaliicoccus vitulinus]MEB7657953.1 hypothetical protein [Mammaliicoccus vitulinus]